MCDQIRASIVSVACLVRGVPLFFRAAPRTPLRVLAIIALDTMHVLRHSTPLPRERIRELALLLDFQARTNARWDDKAWCEAEYASMRQRLENAGLGPCMEEYLRGLRALETRRPLIGGDHRRFDDVRSYREGVARVSLATPIAVALGVRATPWDRDIEALFRIVMQCQIIDDVVDYAEDRSAGLPSFLTACASLPLALELTAQASRDYATSREMASDHAVFPVRMALRMCAAIARLFVLALRRASPKPWRRRERAVATPLGQK